MSVVIEPEAPKRRRGRGRAALAKAVLRHRDRGRAEYERSDRALTELLSKVKPGKPFALGDGRQAQIVDLFAEKLKVFRSHGIARFELQVVER